MAKGFTIIELLIVLSLVAIIASLGIAVSLDRYRLSLLQNDVRLVVDLLTQARTEAMYNQNAPSHGLKIEPNQVTLLPENERYPVNSTLNNANSAEVIFSSMSGIPLSPISFTLTNGLTSKTITVNPQGTIEN